MINPLDLFKYQRSLEDKITEKYPDVEEDKEFIDKKFLWFLVELSELANETKCFKYCSKQKPDDKNVQLEEYADGLHLILGLGISHGFDDEVELSGVDLSLYKKETVTKQFLFMYHVFMEFSFYRTLHWYQFIFKSYMALGEMLGFSVAEIVQSYIEKNKINHKRQEEGY